MSLLKGKHGALLIAEIGGNHEGDFEYAKKLVSLAIESPADVIKLQMYTGDTLVSSLESPQRNTHFKKFELTKKQYIELVEKILDGNKRFTASVWDINMLDWIDPYLSFYKIGSGDLTSYPVIENIVKRRKPIVLSTGLSTETEVLETIKFIQDLDNFYNEPENLAILQCTSMYPISSDEVNLNVMRQFKKITGLPVGYSDHTIDSDALFFAYTQNAEILEFHFTDTKEGKSFRDHFVSLTKIELEELVDRMIKFDRICGVSTKVPLNTEIENDHLTTFRRAVYPSIDISKGEIITTKNLTVLRPNHGIDAREYYQLLGKKAKINLVKHQRLDWDYFE